MKIQRIFTTIRQTFIFATYRLDYIVQAKLQIRMHQIQ